MPTNAAQLKGEISLDTYMQIEGVEGEALDDKHKNWIELLSWQHEMTQPTSGSKGSAGGAATGRVTHGNFIISKLLDKASVKLFEAMSTGKHFKTVKIECCRAGGSQLKYFEIILSQVMIANIEVAQTGASTDLPTEIVALNYSKIEWIYTQQKRADGSGGGNMSAVYDLAAGKA